MDANHGSLSLRIFGVPLHITVVDDDEAHARLRVCYAMSLASDSAAPGSRSSRAIEPAAVDASMRRDGDGYALRVGDFTEQCDDRGTAVRTLNHEIMMALMLAAPHYFYVHAGVVAFGEHAVVLPGLSRAGKSTLVLALLDRGARFLTDELLAYDPQARRIAAFPRALKLRDECTACFPAHVDNCVGEGEGRFLRMESLGEDAVAGDARVGSVVVPQYDAKGTNELRPISRGEAALHLTSSALNFGSHRAVSIDHLTDLVRDASTYEVHWSDPHAVAARIVRALREEAA